MNYLGSDISPLLNSIVSTAGTSVKGGLAIYQQYLDIEDQMSAATTAIERAQLELELAQLELAAAQAYAAEHEAKTPAFNQTMILMTVGGMVLITGIVFIAGKRKRK